MRSRVGVGTTPPKVLVTPKPVSSVMIRSTLGAPLGGTTRAGQYGVDCAALRPILPSNFWGGGGSWLPGIVVVASGEPGTPVVCWAGVVIPNASSKEAATSPHGASRGAIAKCFSIMGALRDQRDSRPCRKFYDGRGHTDSALRGKVDVRTMALAVAVPKRRGRRLRRIDLALAPE